MNWIKRTGVLYTFILLLYLIYVKGIEVYANVKTFSKANTSNQIFSAYLGDGWTYQIEGNSGAPGSVDKIISIDATGGVVYSHNDDICRYIQPSPLKVQVLGNCHNKNAQIVYSNYTVLSLDIYFENLPCSSVPLHRKNYVNTLQKTIDIHIVIFSSKIAKGNNMYCVERGVTLLQLKRYIPVSLGKMICEVLVKDLNFYFNYTDSTLSTMDVICLYKSTLSIPLTVKLCPLGNGAQLHILVYIHALQDTADTFVIYRQSETQVRSKRQLTGTGYSPVFAQSLYNVSVLENQQKGYNVTVVTATDADPGEAGKLTYQLHSKNDDRSMEMFKIDSISGLVTTTKPLDRETMSRHEFFVTATDSSPYPYRKSANVSLIVTVLDENDNTPTFDQAVHIINITENMPVPFTVITVIATDSDAGENADIQFSIIDPPNSLTFTIDSKSGVITAKNVFDREAVANYTLVVQAKDQAPPGQQKSSTTTIEIKVLDENDNFPQFNHDSYNVNVSEDINISESPVICNITATDADEGLNALIRYNITDGNSESNFYIDPNTGVVSVKKPLDYEAKQMFRMTVKASDSGNQVKGGVAKTNSTTLSVQIIDVNDNAPHFQNPSYSGSVPENVPVGTSVLSVIALDNDSGINALLEYSIYNISSVFPFSINASTGLITVQVQIDREVKSSYSFIVQVNDKGVPPLTSTCLVDVSIQDVNDNPPAFSQNIFYVTIAENTKLYTNIITLNATDADENELLKYVIVSGNEDKFYDVTSGAITLVKKLDYKIKNRYILGIQVMDKANHSAMAEVHINVTDINKYYPTFVSVPYQLNIDEGMAIGSSVGKVNATDGDVGENGRITYEFVNQLHEFNIDPNTGVITTGEVLDRELQAEYSFDVRASDNGNPRYSDTAGVIIKVNDINDNNPKFDNTLYQATVSEAADVGYLVLTVHAIDNDKGVNAQIRYMYTNGSDGIRDFEIDSSNGAIRVAKYHKIDYEMQKNYTLYILAVDGGIQPLTGSTVVMVKIEDVNDNAPVFPENIFAQIPENTKIGSTVAVITAVDPDEGNNAVVEYSFEPGLDADKFILINQFGSPAIIVNHVDFDYESGILEYHIRLKASSGTLFNIALVSIQIQDVNDNSPILQDFHIIFNNFENRFPSDPIGRIPAFDPDISDRQKLSYKFQLGNEAGFLLLNESSGEITLDSRLNSDVPRNATIQVQVSDGLHEVRATCHLQVRLVTNDMLQNSVTIRMNNMTSDVFLSPLFMFFVDALATIFNTTKNNIFVISVRNDTDVNAEILNVTVSVRQKSGLVDGDQFYSAEFLMEQIYLQRTLLANLSTLQILPFDDNLCLMEVCSNFEKCLSWLQFGEAAKFITSDTMLFRPIQPINGYRCACPAGFTGSDTFHYCDTEVNLCYSSPCNSSGICHSTEGGYTCACKDGFTGANCEINVAGKYNQMSCPVDACYPPSHCVPVIEGGFKCEGCPNIEYNNQFCQLTTRSFPKGSFLMYPTIKSRYRFTIQMKFATQQRDGLLFYNGRFNELHDFIALEIIDTQIQFSFSTGADIVKVSPYIKGGINDGKWHQVTVDYNNMTATVNVGQDCETEISVKYGQSINYTCAARASLTYPPNCSKEGNVYNCQMLLDLTGPLQIGGLPTLPSNFQVQNKDFVGCIRDFYVNNRLLDFNKYVANNGTDVGCSDKQNFCLATPCQNGGTCMEGWSTYLCSCPERWAGKDCSQEIDVSRKLSGTGYLTYSTATIPQVQFPWFNGISFRTRKKRGTLMHIVAGGLESVTIKLVDGYVVYLYNNSQMLQEFNFHSVAVDDGQWHFFEAQWMDNGDVIMTMDYGQRQKQMHIQNNTLSQKAIQQVFVGVKNINLYAAVDYIVGCVGNVRLGNTTNSILLNPMVYNATEGCDSSNSCSSDPCNARAECVNDWEGYTCKCPTGTMGGQCDNICTNYNPCQNMAYCRDQQGQGYYCECGQLQSGKYCEIVAKQPCPSKWWGYPVCGPCHENCSLENGFDPNCDKQTGKCSCKDYYYQPLGSYKCLPCNCYGYGSKSLQCDPLTGQCTCVDGVIGTRCDQCASKYAEIRLDELTNVYGCKVVADYGNCPHVFSHGMWWDTGVAGEMLIQKCPNNAVGEAKRNCSIDCLWQDPDFFNCTNLLFIDQQMDNLISGELKITTFVAKKMVATLAYAVSNTETLYGNDINITMQILDKILSYENLQSGLNLTSEQDNRYLFNIFSVLSNILQTKYTTEWTRLNQEGLGTVQLLDQLETYLSTLLSALELTSMQSPRPYNIISNNIVLGVDYIKKNNFSGINIPKFDNIAKNPVFDEETNLFLPQSVLSDPPVRDILQPDLSVMPTAYVGYIMFKNLGDLLPKKYATNVRVVSEHPISVNSLVFTIILKDAGINVTGPLGDPIEIKFKQLLSENRTSPQCVAWDEASPYAGKWSTAGCVQLDHYTQEDKVYVTCSCNHMTSFAVLMDISDHEYIPAVPISIGVITYIGLILCMACLVLCCVILVSLKRVHSNTSSIHVNLVFVMFVAQLAFVLGINKIEKQLNCRLVAISLHYFYMATFSWLFVDVLHLYRMLTEIRSIDSGSMKFYYLIAYVIPGIIVGLAVGLNAEGYGSSSFCWLSLTDKFIWSFAGPITVSVIINIFMFALAVKASCREKLSVADVTHLRIGLFANIVILVLWAIIWVIGLLAVNFNYTALYVINAVLCLALGIFIFFVYIVINSKVHVELKKLWYKCRGHKLDPEDNVAGTKSSAYNRSALAYRNDSCDTGLSRNNVGISAESTTSRSSKSSGGLYKGEDYLRSPSTSTSDNVLPVKFPNYANLPPPYDPEKLDDPISMQLHPQRDGNDSDSDSELSEHSLDLASSHSSDDDDDDNDGILDWENKLPKNKIIEEAKSLARKKKEEFLLQQQQQLQQQQPAHHLPQPSSPVVPVAQHQYQNPFGNIYSGSISPRYLPQPMHTTSHWPGDPQLSGYTASESEYRSSDQPTLSSNQPDVTLQTPEYRGREFKIAIPRRTDSFLSDSTSSAGHLHSPLGSPHLKHTPREASTSPIQMLNSPLNMPKENIAKVFTHHGSISTDSECSHETCV